MKTQRTEMTMTCAPANENGKTCDVVWSAYGAADCDGVTVTRYALACRRYLGPDCAV